MHGGIGLETAGRSVAGEGACLYGVTEEESHTSVPSTVSLNSIPKKVGVGGGGG